MKLKEYLSLSKNSFNLVKIIKFFIILIISMFISFSFLFLLQSKGIFNNNIKTSILTEVDTNFQIFYDTGKGFNEKESIRYRIQGSQHKQRIKLFLPNNNILRLRVDFMDESGVFFINKIDFEINDRYYKINLNKLNNYLNNKSVVINNFISSYDVLNTGVLFKSTGKDPYLIIKLSNIESKILSNNKLIIGLLLILFVFIIFIVLLKYKNNILDFLNQKSLTADTFIVFLFIIVSSFIFLFLFFDYIFGDKLFIFRDIGSDTINSYYPYYYRMVNHFKDFAFYDFSVGIGGSVFLFLAEPFSIINLLIGADNIANSLIYSYWLKIILSGTIMYFLLLSLNNNDRYTSFLFSLLYSFSGFIMLWGQHYFFSSWIVYFTLMLYSVDLYLKRNKYILFLLASFFSLFYIYIYIPILIFTFLFFLYRSSDLNIPIIKRFKLLLNFFILTLISFLLALFILLPFYHILSSSPRISLFEIKTYIKSLFSLYNFKYYIVVILRFFGNFSTGGIKDFFGFINLYESPQLYSGLISLLLFPVYLFGSNSFMKKNKVKKYVFIFLLLSLLLPSLTIIYNGLQTTQTRWTYGIIFFIILFASKVLSNKTLLKENLIIIRNNIYIYILFLISAYFLLKIFYNFDFTKNITIYHNVFYIILLLIVYYLILKNFHIRLNKVILLLFIIFELIFLNNNLINERVAVQKNNNPYFMDGTVEAINYIKKIDNDMFYRIDKNYHTVFLNDALLQGYNGISIYHSLNSPGYITFLQKMNIRDDKRLNYLPVELTKNNFQTIISRLPPIRNLLTVKYVLSKTNINIEYLDFIENVKGVYIYKNRNYKTFGYLYNEFILEEDFEKFNDQLKEGIIENNIILSNVMKNKMNIKLSDYTKGTKLNENFLLYSEKNDLTNLENIIENININYRGNQFSETALHWAVLNNNFLMIKSLIDNGAKTYLTNKYGISPMSLTKDKKIIDLLSESTVKLENFNIKTFTNDKIIGDVKVNKDSILFFSIPYDKGWNLKINGKKASYYNVNYGFIGIPLKEGSYSIKLYYIPKYFIISFIISILTFILIVIYIFIIKNKIIKDLFVI